MLPPVSCSSSLLSQDEQRLFALLDKSRDPRYYSYSLSSVLEALACDREALVRLGKSLQTKLGAAYQVNIFDWQDKSSSTVCTHTFVGFEYRRLDYARDSLRGNNVVEAHIKAGVYA